MVTRSLPASLDAATTKLAHISIRAGAIRSMREKQAEMDLASIWEIIKKNPEVAAALLGSGVGAGAGALSSLAKPKEERDTWGNMLTGGLAGGLLGLGGGLAYKHMPQFGGAPAAETPAPRTAAETDAATTLPLAAQVAERTGANPEKLMERWHSEFAAGPPRGNMQSFLQSMSPEKRQAFFKYIQTKDYSQLPLNVRAMMLFSPPPNAPEPDINPAMLEGLSEAERPAALEAAKGYSQEMAKRQVNQKLNPLWNYSIAGGAAAGDLGQHALRSRMWNVRNQSHFTPEQGLAGTNARIDRLNTLAQQTGLTAGQVQEQNNLLALTEDPKRLEKLVQATKRRWYQPFTRTVNHSPLSPEWSRRSWNPINIFRFKSWNPTRGPDLVRQVADSSRAGFRTDPPIRTRVPSPAQMRMLGSSGRTALQQPMGPKPRYFRPGRIGGGLALAATVPILDWARKRRQQLLSWGPGGS